MAVASVGPTIRVFWFCDCCHGGKGEWRLLLGRLLKLRQPLWAALRSCTGQHSDGLLSPESVQESVVLRLASDTGQYLRRAALGARLCPVSSWLASHGPVRQAAGPLGALHLQALCLAWGRHAQLHRSGSHPRGSNREVAHSPLLHVQALQELGLGWQPPLDTRGAVRRRDVLERRRATVQLPCLAQAQAIQVRHC